MQHSDFKTIRQQFAVRYSYPVIFTSGIFREENRVLRDVIQETGATYRKCLVVADSGVLDAWPELPGKVNEYMRRHEGLPAIIGPVCAVEGGEACKKNMTFVTTIQELIHSYGLCRHSLVLAIGGGAVLDAAGYAAATAHRGIPIIRIPTTTLSQNDSGVGVKNAINAFGRKNFLGTFAPPLAVLNDFEFLSTLPESEKRAGIAEAIKVALVRDKSFFDVLFQKRRLLARFHAGTMQEMVIGCAELHLEHIRSGDPFETGASRPLDFGHWSAHKCEELTDGVLGHGEAVAMGIALDCLYSYRIQLLSLAELNRIINLLEETGFALYHPVLKKMDIEKALTDFQEHLGGELTLPLINGIGSRVDVHHMDIPLYRRCIDELAARKGVWNGRNTVSHDGQRDSGYIFSGEPGANT